MSYATAIGDQRRRREAMENFISDLLHSNHADVASILKLSIERGWYTRMKHVLREYEAKKEAEIDKICFLHYSEFLGSINELLHMKGSTEELRTRMVELNKDFASTGQDLTQVMIDIEKAQSERDVAANAYTSAKECLEVSRLMNQVREALMDKNFHRAMGLLQQIQQNKSPSIRFMRENILNTWLPKITKNLLEIELLECDNFLIDIRRDASMIGTVLLRRQALFILKKCHHNHNLHRLSGSSTGANSATSTHSDPLLPQTQSSQPLLPKTSYSLAYVWRLGQVFYLHIWADKKDFDKCIPLHYLQCQALSSVTGVSSSSSKSVTASTTGSSKGNNNTNASATAPTAVTNSIVDREQKLVKFFETSSALYYAVYAFTTLDDITSFYNHYRSERQIEIEHKFEGARKSIGKHGLYVSFVTLAAGIVGFFNIECMLSRCLEIPNEGPFSTYEIRTCWNRVCNKLYKLCLEFAESLKTTDDMLCLKEDILLMIETVNDEGFMGLNTEPLYEIIHALLFRFEALQIQRVRMSCEQAFSTLLYQAYEVKTIEGYNKNILMFGLDDNSNNNEFVLHKDHLSKSHKRSSSKSGRSLSSRGSSSSSSSSSKKMLKYKTQLLLKQTNAASSSLLSSSIASTVNNISYPYTINEEEEEDEDGDNGNGNGKKSNSSSVVNTARSGMSTASNNNTSNSNSNNNGIDTFIQSAKSSLNNTAVPTNVAVLNVFKPTKYLFSTAVPVVLRHLYVLVVRHFVYVTKVNNLPSQGEAICNVLQQCYEGMGEILLQFLRLDGSRDTSIAKASQIAIDATTLATSSNALWAMVESALIHYRWSESLNQHIPKTILASKMSMNRVTTEAQDYMYEILGVKVDDLLTTMSFVDYEPTNTPTECHAFVQEVIDFLRVTFICLTNLPLSAIEAVHFTCCTRVSKGIIKFLVAAPLPPSVEQQQQGNNNNNSNNHSYHFQQQLTTTRINVRALQAFAIDVLKLQHFADECMVPHLRQCFGDLADLISAILSRDLLNFASPTALLVTNTDSSDTRQKQQHRQFKNYPNLNISHLADLLEKVVTADNTSLLVLQQQQQQQQSQQPLIATLDTPTLKTLARKIRSVYAHHNRG